MKTYSSEQPHKYLDLWGVKTANLPYVKLPVCIVAHSGELGIPKKAIQTLCVLIRYYSIKGKDPWLSEASIAKEVGVSTRSVRSHIRSLEDADVIRTTKRKGMTNLYSLKPLIGKLNNHLCHFAARALYADKKITSAVVRKNSSSKYEEGSIKKNNSTSSIAEVFTPP